MLENERVSRVYEIEKLKEAGEHHHPFRRLNKRKFCAGLFRTYMYQYI